MASCMPHLCIGSAQFGLPYGVTNSSGAVPYSEVSRILGYALKHSISYIDTAQAYGEAETVLGECLPKCHRFKLTSKLAPQTDLSFTSNAIDKWEESFRRTLIRLKVQKLHTFFVHDVADLSKNGNGYLSSWLLSLKKRGLVENIGVSIYESVELEGIDLDMVDVVQLPYSIYDQRMVQNGTLQMLFNKNIKIQARSAFLQGLLLAHPDSWPEWIPQCYLEHHRAFISATESCNLTLLQATLIFAFSQRLLDSVVIGFCTMSQLIDTNKIITHYPDKVHLPPGDWSLPDSSVLLDPRRWPPAY